MKKVIVRLMWLVALIGLAACRATQPSPLPTRLAAATVVLPNQQAVVEVAALELPPTFTPSPLQLATPTLPPPATPLPTPTPLPTATLNAYSPFTIAALAGRSYGGGQMEIVDDMAENDFYKQYLIKYPSDGLTVYGFMNVPNEGEKFPVAIVLHGYIDPAQYKLLDYTARYAESLVKAGYFVIHPNFRNYPPSDNGDNEFRVGYAIDVLNLIAIIREQAQDPYGILRRADVENVHLWGHSMGGGVVLRVITVNREPYIKAAVLYGSMSGDEQKNFERIQMWRGGTADLFELNASPAMLRAISPMNHLEYITTAVSIHHSPDDATVPVVWSEELCESLQRLLKLVECFYYDGQPHTFHGTADLLFMERVVTFFRSH